MALRASSVQLRVPLPAPPESPLPEVPDPASDSSRTASPTVARLLATAVTDPSFESPSAFALVAKLLDFAAACRLDYASALLVDSDRQEDFECPAAAVPRFASMLLAPEGDLDALDIPTPRSYAEEITGTYVDGMWIFRVKRMPGSPPAFKARYVARGFSQRQGVDYFQTFSPTLKITTLRVLLHIAAQLDYELHCLDFSTAFLQGSLHEEIWLRRPPGFTGTFPVGTQWSLRGPVYGLRQAPREWHVTLRTTLAAPGFAPSTADPSLFLRTDTSLPPFYVLVYVDNLVFATVDTEALTLVKSELQKRHTCTNLGELRSYLGLQITWDRARRTITLIKSHMVHQVLQRFCFQFSSPQPTPLSTSQSLSAPPSDESVEPSGPYPELGGCLMYLMTCTRPDLAYPLSLLARDVAPGRHRKVYWDAAKRVLCYLCSTLGMGLVLLGWGPVVLTGHADASWVFLLPGGAEPGGAEPGGAEPGGAEPGGAAPGGAGSARVPSRGASSRRELLSPQELRGWFARRWGRAAGAGGTTAATESGGARPGGTGAAGPGGPAEAAGVGPTGGSAGASGGTGAAGSPGTRAAGATRVGAGGSADTTGATGVGATGGVGAGGSADAGPSEGASRPRPYFVPLLEQVLGLPPSPGPAPPFECPQPVPSQSQLQPVSPLPASSPYTGPTGGLAERRAPASRPASPARPACTSRRTSRLRPPAVPGTHQMTLRPSTAPLRILLPSPPASSLPVLTDPESDSLRAASPTVARFLASVVTDPSLASTAASALVAELVDFAARCRLDCAASLVAESASVCPPSVGGECALSTDVLEDRQEELLCFAAALPHLVSTLLVPEGDPDAPDIPTPRSYAEAIEGPYSSQWQAAMDAEMASWKSTGTYVDEVPPSGANIVSGMWIFRVKQPPGSPPVFKARYVARGFSQRQGADYFQTFSPTPKMTTLRVLLHVAAQRDYELHSLDFSTAFLQGSLHEDI
ncbi:unnamed protein product [Closterium sp. NIES-54]